MDARDDVFRPPPPAMWLLLIVCALVIGQMAGAVSETVVAWAVMIGGIVAVRPVALWLGRCTGWAVREFVAGFREGLKETPAQREAERRARNQH